MIGRLPAGEARAEGCQSRTCRPDLASMLEVGRRNWVWSECPLGDGALASAPWGLVVPPSLEEVLMVREAGCASLSWRMEPPGASPIGCGGASGAGVDGWRRSGRDYLRVGAVRGRPRRRTPGSTRQGAGPRWRDRHGCAGQATGPPEEADLRYGLAVTEHRGRRGSAQCHGPWRAVGPVPLPAPYRGEGLCRRLDRRRGSPCPRPPQ